MHQRALAIAHRLAFADFGVMDRAAEMQLRIAHFGEESRTPIHAPAVAVF